MSKEISNSLLHLKPILAVGIICGAGIALFPLGFLFMISGFIVFCLFLIRPGAIIPLLLISRSSLDIFTNVGFYAGALLFNIPSLTSLFIVLGGGAYLLASLATKKELFIGKIGKAFAFWLGSLLLWVLVAYVHFGPPGLIALREWVRLASLFFIYLLTAQLAKKTGYARIINYIFWALPIPVLASFYQIFTKTGLQIAGINRVYGTLAHPNSLAMFLVLFIGLTAWKIQTAKKNSLWICLLMIEILVLINCYSISGILMALIVLFVLAFARLKRRQRGAFVFLIIIIAAVFSLTPYGRMRLDELTRTGSLSEIMYTKDISDYSSLSWRVLNWHMLLKEWSKSPVLGFGLDTTKDLVNPWKVDAHNDYLRFLVETGIIGVTIFLCFLFVIGRELLKVYRSTRESGPEFSGLSLTLFSVYFAWILGSLTGNHLAETTYQYYFWCIAGLLDTVKSPDHG
ncbi:MAG: O-antigen ligase family protein [Candidatus Omnitrophota bacterium]